MSFATTIAGELRAALKLLDRLTPELRDPERYHERKSDIRYKVEQAALMLEGHFDIVRPPEPKKAGGARRPYLIQDRNGNVVHVDFKHRRKLAPPPERSR